VPGEVLTLKPGIAAPPVVRGEVLVAPDLAREEAAPERAVRDEPDAQRSTGGQDLVLRVATPERVLRLERADRVRRVRAPDGGEGLGVIAPAVEVRHAHAAEPHRRHDQALGPQVALLHVLLPPYEVGIRRAIGATRRLLHIPREQRRRSPRHPPRAARGRTLACAGTSSRSP